MIEMPTVFVRFLALLVLCAVGGRSANAVLITISSAPAPNVANYTTYTFFVDLAPTENVITFAATFNATLMNQVNPPNTIWENNNGFFPMGTAPGDDSQFEFLTSEWDFIGPGTTESSSTLSASATNSSPGGNVEITTDFNLAHVVLPNNTTGTWQITLQGTSGSGNPTSMTFPSPGMFGTFGAVPEPSPVLLGSFVSVGILVLHYVRRMSRRTLPT